MGPARPRLVKDPDRRRICSPNDPQAVRLAGILLEAVTPGSRPRATRTTSSRNSRKQGSPPEHPSKPRQISVT